MIITCQNCQTHYSVDSRAIGAGKTVRCGNCGNSWHQNPVRVARRMARAPAPVPQYAPPSPYPQPGPLTQEMIDAQMAHAQAAYPAAASPPPPPPEPVPEPAPEPEPEPAPEPAAEPAAEAAPEEAAEPAAEEPLPVPPEGELSPEQLDEMFGDEPEPEAIQPIQDSGQDETVEDMSVLEGLPEPEPIPQVFQPDAEEEEAGAEEKGGRGKLIGIIAAVLVLAIVGGLVAGRGVIVEMWPGVAGAYAMIGLGGEELGAGLEIRDVTSARTVENGVDALVVSGVVANTSDDDRPVPLLRVALLDGNGVEVQHVVAAPLKNRLPPGQNIAFKAQLAEPSALARRLEVTFTKNDQAAAKK